MSSPDGERVEGLRGIGETARASGLSVGTLRFYDGAGLLRPSDVDPRTGYRFYSAEQVGTARLVAVLRAAGMPLAGIRAVVRLRDDPAAVAQVCAAHLSALERDLSQARRLLAGVGELLEPRESSVEATRVTVTAADLRAALRAVRYAVSTDPELPALGGVLVEIDDGQLTVVATDRYRLATATVVATEVSGPGTSALVPVALVDGVLALLGGGGPEEIDTAMIVVDGGRIAVTAGATVEGELLADPFPDFRSLLPSGVRSVTVDAATAMATASGPATERRVGAGDAERDFTVLDAGADGVWVDREFLLQALDASGTDGTVVEFDGPHAPLMIRSARSLALLMPAAPPPAP